MRSTETLALALLLCLPLSAARTFSADYAGSQACDTCHTDVLAGMMKGPHGVTEQKGEWKEHACESCHGPGAKHAASADPAAIVNPAKLRAPEVEKTCLTCHMGDDTHAGHISSAHSKQGVSCVTCHKVHTLVPRTNAGINTQCATCHRDVWASFQKPFGHKLASNAMTCVDCHNPHGTSRVAVKEPACFTCHSDKRGPFSFEHAPVRLEGCGSCHEPHGSVNPRLLTRHEVRLVCLECHANLPGPNATTAALGVVPPSFHDLRSPRYQNCTVCHQSVHGSYTDRFLIR